MPVGVTSEIGWATLQGVVDQRDWELAAADTRYLTHDLHRYSGKFIPQIARQAIELLTHPGDLVLDPYAGSGTTILEAGLADRRAVGLDMNPLAVLIAQAKTTPIEDPQLSELVPLFADLVAGLAADGQSTLSLGVRNEAVSVEDDPRFSDPWFIKWFEPTILRDLLVIDQAIESLQHADEQTLASAALSNILRRSSKAHSRYPNVMFDRNAAPRARPGAAFLKSLQRCVALVAELPALEGLEVHQGDAEELPLPSDGVDAVVTHPPYIGSVPYAEYGLVSLKWFGHDPGELDSRLTGGRRQKRDVVSRFARSYLNALSEMHRVLKPGGQLFLMVGRPVVRGEIIDLRDMTLDFAKKVGFAQTAETERRGVNRRANKMGSEALMFFRKTD